MQLRYLNYCTIYESIGTVTHEFDRDCCFHTVTKDSRVCYMDNRYQIRVYLGYEYATRTGYNNFCILSVNEIDTFLRAVAEYYQFTYSISDTRTDENNYSYVTLTLELSGHIIWHKFILKCIRGLYEYPFNFALKDVFRLMKYPKFRALGYVRTFIFTSYIVGIAANANSDQSLTRLYPGFLPILLSKKTFIARMQECEAYNAANEYFARAELFCVFVYRFALGADRLREIVSEITDAKQDTDYWDRKFEQRVNNIYNVLIPYFKNPSK